jgi:DNA-binding NarL/FixJ family response regulator
MAEKLRFVGGLLAVMVKGNLSEKPDPEEQLTRREQAVWAAERKHDAEIALILNFSVRTPEHHVRNECVGYSLLKVDK